MIFPCDHACTYYLLFGRFKKVKSVLKTKNKKDMPPCGTTLSPCCRAARRQGPGAALRALTQEIDSCRRAPWQQGLNAVGCGGRSLTPWGTVTDVHLSKFLVPPFIFR
jgi:hypothetical protein